MCWVIPPASPAATSVSRIASSSEVLPWSTWPMIVTTGGRSVRSSSESENCGSCGSSSAAVTISSLRSYSSAIALIDSSVRVWVRVAISPIVISFLITSAGARPRLSATSRTVAPELTLVASGSAGSSALGGGSSSSGRRRLPPRRRGGRCGGGPPIWSRRAAWESITTRRFLGGAALLQPPPPPCGAPRAPFFGGGGAAAATATLLRRGGANRFGRGLSFFGSRGGRRGFGGGGGRGGRGLPSRGFFRGRRCGRFGFRRRFLRRGFLFRRSRGRFGAAVALRPRNRLQRIRLLDARSSRFGFDPGCLQP